MKELECKMFGRGTVEVIEDSRKPHLDVVCKVGKFLCWAKRDINHLMPFREGYEIGFLCGSSSWYPKENVRNLVWLNQTNKRELTIQHLENHPKYNGWRMQRVVDNCEVGCDDFIAHLLGAYVPVYVDVNGDLRFSRPKGPNAMFGDLWGKCPLNPQASQDTATGTSRACIGTVTCE
jgi:hypothetical protein